MVDVATFLTELYVMVDDFCQSQPAAAPTSCPTGALSRSEVVTLLLFAQWQHFASEHDFYRYAACRLRGAFPRLPHRSQFNRACRRELPVVVAFFLFLAQQLAARPHAYQVLDTVAVPTRKARRRGRGWLFGRTNRSFRNSVGWFEGFHLLLAVTAEGAISGFGFGAASSKEQKLAETFLALRYRPDPRLPTIGTVAGVPYLVDKGFAGRHLHARWEREYGAVVIGASQRHTEADPHPWPKEWRRWLAGHRQIVETVNAKLLGVFGLDRERPHTLEGFQVRLAARAALHNFCLWFNLQRGRPRLAFADVIDW